MTKRFCAVTRAICLRINIMSIKSFSPYLLLVETTHWRVKTYNLPVRFIQIIIKRPGRMNEAN